MPTPLLTRKEAQAYLAAKGLKISVSTLLQYASAKRLKGKGPSFHRFGEKGGNTYYKPEELDEWVRQRLKPAQ